MIFKLMLFTLLNNAFAFEPVSVECDYNNGMDSIAFTSFKQNYKIIRKVDSSRATVFVKDVKNFSEKDDYVEFQDNSRHTVTFSLKCRKM